MEEKSITQKSAIRTYKDYKRIKTGKTKRYLLTKNGEEIATFKFYGSALSFMTYKLQDTNIAKTEHYVILKDHIPIVSASNFPHEIEDDII